MIICSCNKGGYCVAHDKVSVGRSNQVVIAQDKMNRSVYYREIWNEAIETAANSACTICKAAENIRKLKK